MSNYLIKLLDKSSVPYMVYRCVYVWKKCVYLHWFIPSQYFILSDNVVSVQFTSVTQSCPTLCNPMDCSRPGILVHHQLLKSTQAHVHWLGDAIQPSHPLSSPSPPNLQSLPASGSFQMSKFFISGSQSIGISPSTSVLPMNIQDWFPLGLTGWISLLAVQGTLKSLIQHHSSKAPILWCSAFFIDQLSHPYMLLLLLLSRFSRVRLCATP